MKEGNIVANVHGYNAFLIHVNRTLISEHSFQANQTLISERREYLLCDGMRGDSWIPIGIGMVIRQGFWAILR